MEQRLKEAARVLSELVLVFPAEHFGDLLDITAGAIASLIRAEQLQYLDRINEELPLEYYTKLSERILKMTAGTLPPRGRWIAGYYFNSALLRLGAAREISKRLFDNLDKGKQHSGPNLKSMRSDKLYDEYCSFKHDLRSLRVGRHITFEHALKALDELITVLNKRRVQLSDPNTRFPAWKKRGR
jgi:hypothetical protein